jgi:tetratricopeptide (TPR) repeat protein
MNRDPASTHLQRGMHLLRVRRYAEAEAAFKQALSTDPDNGFALHQLAVCVWQQGNRAKEALAIVQEAIRVEPNDSDHHALKALLASQTNSVNVALMAAAEAVRLGPASDTAWYASACVNLNAKRLQKAEADARTALRFDPNHSDAAAVLSHALRLQGKIVENTGQIAGMLQRDPENDDTHTAAGWNLLHAGKYEEAQTHFREALRLNPESELAREGLVESFKTRSRIYRLYLRWVLWLSGKSDNFQFGLFIGAWLAVRYVRKALPGPLGTLIVNCYLIFVVWVHVARGLGNFILVCDRNARHALRRNEQWEACVVGLCMIFAVVVGAIATVLDDGRFLLYAGTLLAAAIPFSHTFTNESRIGRAVFGAIGGFALFAGFLILLAPVIEGFIKPSTIVDTAFIAILLAAISTWLSNVSALRRR